MKLEDELYLVESFYSIQGEGRFAGRPSIFLRFGGCNLNCFGFGVQLTSPKDGSKLLGCDSIRATNREHFLKSWKKIKNSKELLNEVEKYINTTCKPDIVITGGEPLLHHKKQIFLETITKLIKDGFRITIETNATFKIDFEIYPIYKEVTFSMSVKLKNSGETKEKRINQKAIKDIATNTKNSFFKFVLSKNSLCEEEIKDITKDLNIPIFCMPMGSTSKELAKNDKAVASFCIKNCYNYVDRMHIRLWDNEEGR